MAPVRRSLFVDFGVCRIIKVHSQRVNGLMISAEEKKDKFLLVTKHADQEYMLYQWTTMLILSEEEINFIVKKYLRKIGGYLSKGERAELEEEQVLAAFEATDDEDEDE